MANDRVAWLGACLALPLALGGTAVAAQPDGGRYIYVPAGTVAVLVPSQTMQPVDFPVTRIFAEQQAIMRHMMADMDALMAAPLPDPQQMIRSVMNGSVPEGWGSGVVVRTVISGNGTCSQTITYGPGANGSQPVVKVSQTGNACDAAVGPSSPVEAPQVVAPAPAAPNHPRLWTVGDPPHPIVAGVLPPRS